MDKSKVLRFLWPTLQNVLIVLLHDADVGTIVVTCNSSMVFLRIGTLNFVMLW